MSTPLDAKARLSFVIAFGLGLLFFFRVFVCLLFLCFVGNTTLAYYDGVCRIESGRSNRLCVFCVVYVLMLIVLIFC